MLESNLTHKLFDLHELVLHKLLAAIKGQPQFLPCYLGWEIY